MTNQPDALEKALRERSARYIVGTQGEPVAVLLSLDEYEHYLDLLDDEADSQDKELADRIALATGRTEDGERIEFREYLRQTKTPNASVQG
jgi:PHD/YefM family antitoxin component YafN of YafNO toxin-antitoxin module